VQDLLSTGDDALDRFCNGGIPPGSLIAMEAPPGTQTESLLWTMMNQRKTVYITTLRSKGAVQADVDRYVDVRDNAYRVQDAGIDTPIENASGVIELVDDQVNLFIDTANPLEETDDRDRYVKFLNRLKTHLVNTNGIGLLVCTKSDAHLPGREYTLTIADIVWEIHTNVDSAQVENYLQMRKFRGRRVPDDNLKLILGERLRVDTSRDIA